MNNLKNRIIDGIKFAQERGFTLVDSDWGSDTTQCACALGCFLISNQEMISEDPEDNARVVAEILNVPENWVNNFISGFDGHPSKIYADYEEAWLLGIEIRMETNPQNHTDYINNLNSSTVELSTN